MPETADAPPRGGSRREGATAAVATLLVAVLGGAGAAVAHVRTDSASAAAAGAVLAAVAIGAAVLLVGARRATRPADDQPHGIRRERYYWPLATSVGLHLAAGAAAVTVGVVRVRRPVEPADPAVAIGALAAALVLLALAGRFTVRRIGAARGSTRFGAFVRRAHRPDLPATFVVSVGALVALVPALAGIAAAARLDEPRWDGAGAIGAGAVATITALALVVEIRSLLVSGAPSTRDLEAIRAAIEVEPVVLDLDDVRVVRLGPEHLLVAARIGFLDELDLGEVSAAIDRVGRNVRAAVPAVATIVLEPGVDPTRRPDDTFVPDLVGHIDPGDPDYASITGLHAAIDLDDDIWS